MILFYIKHMISYDRYYLVVLELSYIVYLKVNFHKGMTGIIYPFKSQTFSAGILTNYTWNTLCLIYSSG